MDDFDELHDPPRALRFAERACEIGEDAESPLLPDYLDTLALARHRTGTTAAAIEALRRAISLAPEDKDRSDRAERLAEYEAALAGR